MKINDVLFEFAPSGDSGGSGDYFQALASAWYNGTFDTGSLQKGIKSQQDVERLLNRGIVAPDGKMRKYHIDYNSDFDGVEIYSDDYYEHGDYDDTIDSRTGQKWGPYDFMAFSDDQLDEATGDQKFDSMLSQITSEPKYPDQDMPPTSISELIQWADTNNKPYHEYFAQWARKNGFKNVNDALVWFGDNVDPSNPWGPKDFLDPFGRPAAEELEDAAKHDPKAAELMKVFRCYEEIVFDWPDEYRQMNMPTSRKGTDESLNEFAADDGDSGGEDDVLHKYARMWWAGDEATQQQIEKVLARMGWEIGEDEGGYDNGGVFVVRAGDVNGNSYVSWPAEDLTEGLTEVDRRGFLKGMGAAAVAGAAGGAKATDFTTIPNNDVPFDRAKEKLQTRFIVDNVLVLYYFLKKYKPNDPLIKEIQTEIKTFLQKHPENKDNVNRSWATTDNMFTQFQNENPRGYERRMQEVFTNARGIINQFKNLSEFNESVQQGMAEGNRKSEPPEADYGADYQDMVSRVKKLAGLGPLKTVYDPAKRVYKNVPTAVQPKKEQR